VSKICEKQSSGAKARIELAGLMYGLKPVPFTIGVPFNFGFEFGLGAQA
jgi:hypothetical protein